MTRPSITAFALALLLGVTASCIEPATHGECLPGHEGCECDLDDLCNAGLACQAGVCVEPRPSDTDGLEELCSEGVSACEGADLLVCEAGSWTSHDCGELCHDYGYAPHGCAGGLCECGGPLDAECALGVEGYCACAPIFAKPCSAATAQELYTACWRAESQLMRCFADYVYANGIDCGGALASCL